MLAEDEARLQQLLDLAGQMRDRLDGEQRALWLELEEALHAYWQEVAAAHYDLGVEAASARHRDAAPDDPSAPARLRALARELARIADELE